MVYKAKVPDVVNTLIHILAHKLRNMIVKAVISKRNMVVSIVYEGFCCFILTMATKSHAVIKYRSKAYNLIRVRINKELYVVKMPVIVVGQCIKDKQIPQSVMASGTKETVRLLFRQPISWLVL